MRPVIRKPSVQTVQQADEVEQRSDVRVSLAVVVTEQAFVVTDQARVGVRSDELIVVRETLVSSELECAIVPSSAAERAEAKLNGQTIGQAFARVEDEVIVSIIKRAVFDDRSLRAVNTTGTNREVAGNFE